MELLIDTHVFLWWTTADSRIPGSWIDSIVNPANTVFISAATAWEIAIKRRSGKLSFDSSPSDAADEHGFAWLSMSHEDGFAAGDLEWDHRDPFDRMLVAQSIRRQLTLVTSDAAMRSAPGIRLLD